MLNGIIKLLNYKLFLELLCLNVTFCILRQEVRLFLHFSKILTKLIIYVMIKNRNAGFPRILNVAYS